MTYLMTAAIGNMGCDLFASFKSKAASENRGEKQYFLKKKLLVLVEITF